MSWQLRTDQEITKEIDNLNRVIATTKDTVERKYLEAQKAVLEIGLQGNDMGVRIGRAYEDGVLKRKLVDDDAVFCRAFCAFRWLISYSEENAPSNISAHGLCWGLKPPAEPTAR